LSLKNILVTGGNGQLGSDLKELFRQSHGVPFYFYRHQELDLLDERATRDFFGRQHFDYVINCAAYTAVDKAEEEKDSVKK